jgi:uncharacterized membrane protein YfcA
VRGRAVAALPFPVAALPGDRSPAHAPVVSPPVDLTAGDHLLAALAALGAGAVNALAGGGTLLTFPALVALGVPAVRANVTNTVALCPGYFGGAHAQRRDLADQRHRLRMLALAAAAGGLCGSILLVASSERLFRGVVPWLLFGACLLLGFGDRIKKRLPQRSEGHADARPSLGAAAAIFVSSVYGGYFGAGLGIVLLAVLGLLIDDTLPRCNALKQAISLVTNVVAALFFVTSGKVVWSLAVVMAPASLVGGAIGGRLVGRIKPQVLRAVVITSGIAVAVKLLLD